MIPEERALRRAIDGLRYSGQGTRTSENFAEHLEEKLNALMSVVIVPTGERVHHTKRGTTYDVFGVGHANSSNEVQLAENIQRAEFKTEKVLFDRDEVVIYRDVQSGEVSIRGTEEFRDGRFTQVRPPYAGPIQDAHADVAEAVGGAAATTGRKARAEPALSAPYGTPEKLPRVRMNLPSDGRHKQVGQVESYNGDGTARVLWDGYNLTQNINVLNLVPEDS